MDKQAKFSVAEPAKQEYRLPQIKLDLALEKP
jgi:hypothetical protein